MFLAGRVKHAYPHCWRYVWVTCAWYPFGLHVLETSLGYVCLSPPSCCRQLWHAAGPQDC